VGIERHDRGVLSRSFHAYPGIAQETGVLRALYYLAFSFGGVGFSVPLGLLIAGICISAAVMKLLPRWLVVFGLALAVIGELSALSLVFPQALLLIPLTRFPGFVWLIAAGFALPKGKSHQNSTADATNPPTIVTTEGGQELVKQS
jgi:hypothetical protein